MWTEQEEAKRQMERKTATELLTHSLQVKLRQGWLELKDRTISTTNAVERLNKLCHTQLRATLSRGVVHFQQFIATLKDASHLLEAQTALWVVTSQYLDIDTHKGRKGEEKS